MNEMSVSSYAAPPVEVKCARDARELIEQRQIKHIKVGITDLNGVLRGKYLSTSKFLNALEHGLGFCDVILGTDIDDQLCDGLNYTGWHSGYPDARLEIIAESCRQIPFEPRTLLFLAQFACGHDQLCPRSLLQRVISRADGLGLAPYCALEFEFSMFDESIGSLRKKHYRDLTTLTQGNCGYSLLRVSTYNELYQELLDLCEGMNMSLEGLHTEIGPGVLEAALAYDHALLAADKATLFKTFTKVVAQRNGLLATFMAKWDINQQGQSGHTHISLRDKDDHNVFYDAEAEHGISATMRHFIAGQQRLMPELLAMVAPNMNSFARLVPGFWAPTQASWGIDNRTCALRIITGGEAAQRVEYRVPGADTNPYLAIVAALASGLWGIENKLEPMDPTQGNAYEVQLPNQFQLPRSLNDAAQRLRASEMAREYFGSAFVDDYAATREWEAAQAQRQVTDWQLQRYFESA